MNQKIKDVLGVAVIIALLGVGYGAVSYVSTYAKSTQGGYRSFSVSGEGKVVTVPDVAEFSFTVLSEGNKNIADIQKENTDKSNKAIAFLKAQKVDAKDIRTESYNLEPRYQYYNCGVSAMSGAPAQACPPASIVGYTIRQSVSVKVRDFAKIGSIMSGVVDNGANQVSSLTFTTDDPTKPRNDARAEAIAKARANAQAIADASGFSLGKLLSIDESNTPQPYYDTYGRGGGVAVSMETKSVAPSIEPGSSDVKVSVTLRYEIQ